LPPPPAPPAGEGLRRVAPQQVLLAAGAVALVVAGAASLSVIGRLGSTVLALAALAASVRSARRGLRASEETLAIAAVSLSVLGDRASPTGRGVLVLGLLAGLWWLLGRIARSTVTWPVAAWLAAQFAVLTALTGGDAASLTQVAAVLGTAVAGLLVALRARRPVSEIALVTAAPWWVTGVVAGLRLVWTTSSGPAAVLVGLLLVAAAGALLALRRRPSLRPLLGPRPAVPVLAGGVTGAAVAGVLQALGPAGVPAAGYVGLVTAALVGQFASPHPRSLLRPAGLALAATATGASVVRLLVDGHGTALALLLLTAAAPAVLVAARQPADRPGALPVMVGCLAGSALLAEADGSLAPGWTGPLLLTLAVVALAAATLERHSRAEVPLAVSAVVVGAVAVAHVARTGHAAAASVALAVLGAALVGYADRTERVPARAVGCAALVGAAWLAVGDAGVRVPEAYTLPLAAVLLLYAGRRLRTGDSWGSWGPALLAAFGPSVVLGLVQPDLLRVLLVVAATLTTITATGEGVRAPFLVGATSLVVVAVGRLAAVLPAAGSVAVAVAGVLLLGVGASYESRRQAREAVASLADMR
uniref:SCO7613 C-terminal domain-containing membrane protein n=1 Tax=Modestobacter excelsi TaxID=2213161 RepID=UPI001C20F0A8